MGDVTPPRTQSEIARVGDVSIPATGPTVRVFVRDQLIEIPAAQVDDFLRSTNHPIALEQPTRSVSTDTDRPSVAPTKAGAPKPKPGVSGGRSRRGALHPSGKWRLPKLSE